VNRGLALAHEVARCIGIQFFVSNRQIVSGRRLVGAHPLGQFQRTEFPSFMDWYLTSPIFTPMLCIRCGESCIGASAISGWDGAF